MRELSQTADKVNQDRHLLAVLCFYGVMLKNLAPTQTAIEMVCLGLQDDQIVNSTRERKRARSIEESMYAKQKQRQSDRAPCLGGQQRADRSQPINRNRKVDLQTSEGNG